MSPEVHTLAGAYALDALPPEEAAAFEAHLEHCAACRQEVAELQVTAAHLGLQASQQPPPGLRERVLQAAGDTRQVPPPPRAEVTDLPEADSGHRGAPRWPRWPRWLAAAAAAAVVVGAVALGVRGWTPEGPDVPPPPAARVLAAPDAHSATAPVRGGGALTVISSPRLGRAVVLSERLPGLAPGRVYQLWLVDRAGHARPADVLLGPEGPASRSSLVRQMRPGDSVAITREPAGGSDQPTTKPLALVRTT